MNWVGGARSRVKHFNNNRVQRDYFESKRLAAKLQRLQPARKKDASQDLYFFNTTVTGRLKPGSSSKKHDKPTKLTKLECRGDIPSMKDLELSMSPIGQPSSTDVMDITVLSTMADQEVSFYGPEQVKEQPRVSTLKLPHLVQQDRSRLTSKNDIKDDSTCASESLLPPTKKLKTDISAPSKPHSDQYHRFKHISDQNQKTFCIDELLNAPCFNKDPLVPAVSKPPPAVVTMKKFKVERERALLSRDHEVPNRARTTTTTFHGGPDRKKSRKHEAPHHQRHHQPHHFSNLRGATSSHGGNSHNKAVVIYDKDAMLEFHFDEQGGYNDGEGRQGSRQPSDKYQRVPENTNVQHSVVDLGPMTSSHLPTEQLTVSASNAAQSVWSSATSNKHASSSALTENPFSRQHLVEPDNVNECSNGDHNATLFNESIFGPILNDKKQQRQQSGVEYETRCVPAFKSKALQRITSKEQSKPSMFERMIAGFESKSKRRKREKGEMNSDKGKEVVREGDKPISKNLEWRNFITGATKPVSHPPHQLNEDPYKCPCEPRVQGEPSRMTCGNQVEESEVVKSTSSSSNNLSKKFRNISVLEELICLEDEIAAELASQDCPLTPADWTEDPIFTRVQERETSGGNKTVCEFDSSQESTEANKGSFSSNESVSSMSMSGCSSSLNKSPLNMSTRLTSSNQRSPQPKASSGHTHSLNPHSSNPHSSCLHSSSSNSSKPHSPHLSSLLQDSPVKDFSHGVNLDQVIQDECRLPLPHQGSHDQKSIKVTNQEGIVIDCKMMDLPTICVETDNESQKLLQVQASFKSSSLSVADTTSQTVAISTVDHSTQWSPVNAEIQTCSSEMLAPTTLQPGKRSSSEASTQTVATASPTFACELSRQKPVTRQLDKVDKSVQISRDSETDSTDKLKKEVERMERELGMAQSTVVWQSLMMQLHQL